MRNVVAVIMAVCSLPVCAAQIVWAMSATQETFGNFAMLFAAACWMFIAFGIGLLLDSRR